MKGRVQKILGILLPVLILSLLQTPSLQAQRGDVLSARVSLVVRAERLDTVLARLTTLTGVPFAYSPDRIDVAQRVTLLVDDLSLAQALDLLTAQARFEYRLRGRKILILPAKDHLSAASSGRLFTVSGFVTDSLSGEQLPYAGIRLMESGGGLAANSYGFFSLLLPAGHYTLAASYVGYATRVVPLIVRGDTSLTLLLPPAEASLEQVKVIHTTKTDLSVSRNGLLILPPAVVSEMPSFLGESDVMKSLEMMPGITFFGDGSTFFFVRGGNRDQNLILIDDAPVYNPSHMFGIFSSVTPEAVKSVRVYKSFFPADVGGRLSSVIDIRTRDGDRKQFGVEGAVSPATVRMVAQGPVLKEKSSFFLSARRSWFGWMLRAGDNTIERLRFYDLNGRFNTTLNDRNRLYVSFYKGDDLFRQRAAGAATASGITWGNLTGSVRWNHLFGPRLFLNTTVYGGSYDYDLVSSFEDDFSWHSHVADFGVRSDLGWFRRTRDKIRGGIALSGHNYNPGNIYFRGSIAGGNFPLVPVKNTLGASLYVMREHNPLPHLTLNYGLRLTAWFNMGSTWEYRYDAEHQPLDSVWYGAGEIYHTSFAAEPRLSATLTLGDNTLSAAYSLTSQYMHMLTNQVTPFSSFEIWVPAGPNLKPQRAHQIQTGWSRTLAQGRYSLDAELYVRKMTGQTDYTDHAALLLNPPLESDLRQGSARVWGAELLLQKREGRLTGWLSYTWSHIRQHTPAVNDGKAYAPAYERPHALTLAAVYHLSGHWQAGTNLLAASGTPVSSPTAFFQYNGQTIPWYGSRNNSRLPPYFRMDLSVTWKMSDPEKRFHHDLTLGIYNATGRKNPFEINFNKIILPDNSLAVPSDFYTPPELITTQMYLFRVIPSVTYHFKF